METLNFLNTYADWEETLSSCPYRLTIKHLGNYTLLKYNQFDSDFSLNISKECRGAIFYKHPDNTYECVCRGFDKFFNYGQDNCAEIDWESAVVEEKVDGTLIRMFYHLDNWHLATNGNIDASLAPVSKGEKSFADLVYAVFGSYENWLNFCARLDKNSTYFFELVSPENPLTVFYAENKLYYLGQRDMRTMQESKEYTSWMAENGILVPKEYSFNNLKECCEYVSAMSANEEGVVVRDAHFNRIKIKSPEFLRCFHAINNNVCTTKMVLKMLKDDTLDDFVAYAPRHKMKVEEVLRKVNAYVTSLENQWEDMRKFKDETQKDFYYILKEKGYECKFLIQRKNGNAQTAFTYFTNLLLKDMKEKISSF